MVILRDLRIENCEITVDVGDTSNSGLSAVLKFTYSVNGVQKNKTKKVNLRSPAVAEQIPPTERTGKIHEVTATLTADDKQVKSTMRMLKFCA